MGNQFNYRMYIHNCKITEAEYVTVLLFYPPLKTVATSYSQDNTITLRNRLHFQTLVEPLHTQSSSSHYYKETVMSKLYNGSYGHGEPFSNTADCTLGHKGM